MLGYVYFRFKEEPAVKGVLHGASAAAVALTLAMVIKTGKKCLTGWAPVMLFVASFALNGLLRWPLLATLAILAPLKPRVGVAEEARRVKTYLQVLTLFGSLSLMSIGGGNAVLPEMHLRAVKGSHWLTNAQFADIFSISQAAPCPSILIVALVGYAAGLSVGGVLGGILGGVPGLRPALLTSTLVAC